MNEEQKVLYGPNEGVFKELSRSAKLLHIVSI
jgi:hypothetical protein